MGSGLVTGRRPLATCSIDEAVRIWDAHTGVAIATLTGHDDAIRRVSWSPDGSRIASASNDRTGRIWDARTGSLLHVLRGHEMTVRAAEWSGDSRRMVTASDDRVALIWDTEHGTRLPGCTATQAGSWVRTGRTMASESPPPPPMAPSGSGTPKPAAS